MQSGSWRAFHKPTNIKKQDRMVSDGWIRNKDGAKRFSKGGFEWVCSPSNRLFCLLHKFFRGSGILSFFILMGFRQTHSCGPNECSVAKILQGLAQSPQYTPPGSVTSSCACLEQQPSSVKSFCNLQEEMNSRETADRGRESLKKVALALALDFSFSSSEQRP